MTGAIASTGNHTPAADVCVASSSESGGRDLRTSSQLAGPRERLSPVIGRKNSRRYVGRVSDVLEGGGSRRSGPPRWVWLVAGVVIALGAASWAAAGGDRAGKAGSDRPPAAGPASASSPSPSPSPSLSLSPPSPWPSAAGACGSTAFRSLLSAQPLTERIGVRLLVGGYGVRLVDADTGTARPVRGIPTDATHTVSGLVSAAGVVYTTSARCDGVAGRVYRLDDGTAHPLAATPVDGLLAGAGRVWAVDYPDEFAPPTIPVRLRPLNGGRAVALPSGAYPVADAAAGIVAGVDQVSAMPHVVLLDPSTGRPVRTLGAGIPLAVDRSDLLLQLGSCALGRATASCTIARIDLRTGHQGSRYVLPTGRVPVSAGSVSRDGRLAVFQLARAHTDPRFDPGHPIPPADIALLHLDTGRLDIVPNLELAPKTDAGLVIADDGSWLFVAVNDGDHTHLLAWHPGLDAPRSVARLPGPINGTPSLLIA
ncbi:MAG TPA: hypothetical protein VGP36_18900 [Mycobacteriales bacterium]|nr:hypothetical protein [Mycobacteriales bacterium]